MIKLYCIVTKDYIPLYEILKKSSEPTNTEVFPIFSSLDSGPTGTEEYLHIARFISENMALLVKKNEGNTIVLSDSDVQLFGDLPTNIGQFDFVCQGSKVIPSGGINPGFLIVKCSKKTVDFFNKFNEKVNEGKFQTTALVFNKLLFMSNLSYVIAPKLFFPALPKSIGNHIVHHVSYLRGINKKIEEMKRVRNLDK